MDKSETALRDSTARVTEYLGFAINAVLYHRNLYPSNTFQEVQRHGVPLWITVNDTVKTYLSGILSQIAEWVAGQQVRKVVLPIKAIGARDTLEVWTFDIQTLQSVNRTTDLGKDLLDMSKQISASASFLPEKPNDCAFELYVFTEQDCEEPPQWTETKPVRWSGGQTLQLRPYQAPCHKVSTEVLYFPQ